MMRPKPEKPSSIPLHEPLIRWPVLLLVVLFDLAILLSGHFIYVGQHKRLLSKIENNLNSVAQLKIHSLEEWRAERNFNAEIYHDNRNFSRQLLDYIRKPDSANRLILDSWMNIALADRNVDQIILFGPDGNALATLPLFAPLVPYEIHEKIVNLSLKDGVTWLDFYSQGENAIRLALVIPIADAKDSTRQVGKVFIRINPEVHLYPYLQSWPYESETGESLLARVQNDSAQFLNKLRFTDINPLQLKFPLSDTSIAAVKGLHGFHGIFVARDYRNVQVISAVLPISDSPWILVAKEDSKGLFRDINRRLVAILIIVVLAVFIMTSAMLWFFRQQKLKNYRALYLQQKERDWLYGIMEHNLNEIFVFDAQSLKFRFVNFGARKNLGYSLEELMNMTPVDIKPQISENEFQTIITPLRNGQLPVQVFKTVHQRKNGSSYPVEVFLELMESDKGPVYLAMINDITERVRMDAILQEQHEELILKNQELENLNEELQTTIEELQQTSEELQTTNEELQQLSEELQTTNEELNVNIHEISSLNKELKTAKTNAEIANRLKSSFLANMSHEIRTPLNGIMGFSELLVETLETPEQLKMANIILNSSTRLLETVNSILDISLLESGSLSVVHQRINLADLARESINLYTVYAERKNIRLVLEIKENSFVLADENMTLKIINNLVNNALKYTDLGKIVIEVGMKREDDNNWGVVSVTDTGIGISEDDIKIIFDEFRQVSEGLSKKHSGSGLGLNISKRYAETMNGYIKATSRLGEGSSFTLYLPECTS